jgi:hemolysin activation/secretion protein
VTELRTLASGERVKEGGVISPENRVDHPLHQPIRDRSPIQPSRQGDAVHRDLLRKDVLDEYLFFLSRHPGRRVDASVAAAEEPGGVALDYQLTENPPFIPYAQISNTGTPATDRLRERFGFVHSQLTNNDDILAFDYVTAWFDEANAVIVGYEAPFKNDRFRWRVHGNWQEFDASEVGFFGDEFDGESWALGGEVIWNFFQKRELFLDLVAGVRYEDIEVDNQGFAIQGEAAFVIPLVAVRLDRTTEWYSTQASLGLEYWLTSADEAELEALGRTDPDADTPVLQGSLTHAMYLEPLVNRAGWEDPTTPEDSTLAHEVVGSIRGQYAFEKRLIPQAEQVVGGLYTVRGYPESIVAGDSIVIGTLEYRYHLPRAFGIEPEPRRLFGQPFRVAPQYVYGRPDWDLILKAFLDVGRTYQSDRLSFESDDTLIGMGIGVELVLRRNINVRLDWGFALEDLAAGSVDAGDNRLHFVATFLF